MDDHDFIEVYFSGPPGPPRAMSVWREIAYGKAEERPTGVRFLLDLTNKVGRGFVWPSSETTVGAYHSDADRGGKRPSKTVIKCEELPVPMNREMGSHLKFKEIPLGASWRVDPLLNVYGAEGLPISQACGRDLRVRKSLDRPMTLSGAEPGVVTARMLLVDPVAVISSARREAAWKAAWIEPLEQARIEEDRRRRMTIVPKL
ncbi:hypothetical protein [Caulobacter sp. DWR1-3-2b1]|uniref:hypothetical protein n=1 Tax=Caulobacter sp. DWR1-3-2b1 TaxID=2804670 RepID=UPI003CF3F55A